jgi:hypothetical protein
MPGPGILPGVTTGTSNGAFARPLSGSDLTCVARLMPHPAVRAGESPRALAGAVETASSALVDPAAWSRPARCPAAGLGRRHRRYKRNGGRSRENDYLRHCRPPLRFAVQPGGEWWRPCPGLFAGILSAAGPNIAICCRADLPLAHRMRRKDNDGHDETVGENPRRGR